MNALAQQIDQLLQDPLHQAQTATAPVGYVGFDLPLDLVAIPDRLFCHLPWRVGRATPLADEWLESAFPGWARSMLQDWYEGRFDLFSHVVFSRGDDAGQRLYYYLCELRRRGVTGGPEPLILDVAYIQRESSVRHCQAALKRLLATLEIDHGMLERGTRRANELRALHKTLESARNSPGSFIENLSRASLFGDLFPAMKPDNFPEAVISRRLVLAGSVPPDDRLHRAAEAKGWTVSGELHGRTLWRHGEPVTATGAAALEDMAQRMNAGAHGPRAFINRTDTLLTELSRARADAAVLWLTEEDEAFAWHVADQVKALQSQKIPYLLLTRRRWDGSDAADVALQEFLESQT